MYIPKYQLVCFIGQSRSHSSTTSVARTSESETTLLFSRSQGRTKNVNNCVDIWIQYMRFNNLKCNYCLTIYNNIIDNDCLDLDLVPPSLGDAFSTLARILQSQMNEFVILTVNDVWPGDHQDMNKITSISSKTRQYHRKHPII